MFAVGLLGGGLTTAAAAWLLTGLFNVVPPSVRLIALVGAAGAALLQDLGTLSIPLPQAKRLIPRQVFDDRPMIAAVRFGYELGTGVRTYVPSAAPYLLIFALWLMLPPFSAAIAAGLGFGAGRAANPISRLASGNAAVWDDLMRRRLSILAPWCITGALGAVALLISMHISL